MGVHIEDLVLKAKDAPFHQRSGILVEPDAHDICLPCFQGPALPGKDPEEDSGLILDVHISLVLQDHTDLLGRVFPFPQLIIADQLPDVDPLKFFLSESVSIHLEHSHRL